MAVLLLCGMIVAAGLYVAQLATVQRDYFLNRRGELTGFRISTVGESAGGAVVEDVGLQSSNGLKVELRVLLPAEAMTRKVPVLLLLGGHGTGRHAVDLISAPRGIAYASIDYPYSGKHSLAGFGEIVAAVPRIQQAFLDTPPALMLGLDWLSRQAWFDPQRAELVGISLGVPFAAVAGALDKRFTRIWLLHGAADNHEWVMHAARERISNPFLRSAAVRGALLLAYGNSFRTDRWIQEIAPRPLIVVAARNDDRVPSSALQPFIDADARGQARVIWTEGQHIEPDRERELGQLIEIVVGAVAEGPTT